jgi:ankyrin repeat protein
MELIEKGANINAVDEEYLGYTGLMYAIENKDKELVKYLLENGADVNYQEEYWGYTPLMLACREGITEIVKILIEKGADVNIKDKEGWTALTYALKNKNERIVELLKSYGAKE